MSTSALWLIIWEQRKNWLILRWFKKKNINRYGFWTFFCNDLYRMFNFFCRRKFFHLYGIGYTNRWNIIKIFFIKMKFWVDDLGKPWVDELQKSGVDETHKWLLKFHFNKKIILKYFTCRYTLYRIDEKIFGDKKSWTCDRSRLYFIL